MDQQKLECEENTFLFGAKKIRYYGSIDDLNCSSASTPKFARVILHKVTTSDTLQSLELRYNSSVFEIKRLNKLWSDQSLYCKSEVLIPVFDTSTSGTSISFADWRVHGKNNIMDMNRLDEEKMPKEREEESLDQLLKRIDLNVKQTKKAVKRLYRVQSEHNS